MVYIVPVENSPLIPVSLCAMHPFPLPPSFQGFLVTLVSSNLPTIKIGVASLVYILLGVH